MARNTKIKLPVMISDCTDPYQPLEREKKITRKCIQALVEFGFPLLIVTKSDMVTRDIDLFKKTSAVVAETVTTIREDIAKLIEPNAPTPEKRIKALEKITAAGLTATARVDPIVPYVNDDPAEFEKLISSLADVGIRQITISTVKPVKCFFVKIKQVFPEKHEKIARAYEDAEWLTGYKYLAARKRRAVVNKLRPIVQKHGLEFAACREGFPELNTITCDGTAYCQTTATLTKYIK
jgi:DNA repair photolyase